MGISLVGAEILAFMCFSLVLHERCVLLGDLSIVLTCRMAFPTVTLKIICYTGSSWTRKVCFPCDLGHFATFAYVGAGACRMHAIATAMYHYVRLRVTTSLS